MTRGERLSGTSGEFEDTNISPRIIAIGTIGTHIESGEAQISTNVDQTHLSFMENRNKVPP